MKKLYTTGLVLALASAALAQAGTTTTYSSAVTLKAGNCTITGVTTLADDGNGVITTNGTDSCTPNNGNSTAVATLKISGSSYTIGSSGLPTITVTNTAPVAISCALSASTGTEALGVTPTTVNIAASSAGTFSVATTPTAAGTDTFSPTCTTSAANYNSAVSLSPTSVALTVSASTPPDDGSCSSTQTATVGGKTLTRQCRGTALILPGPINTYSGPFTDLGTVLGNTTFPNFQYSGYTPTYTIAAGSYIALAFTPTTTGSVQLSANTSYGDGGIISLSTVPGALLNGQAGTICSLSRGGSNSLFFGTSATCTVQLGTKYYINLTDTDTTGNFLCYSGTKNLCSQSQVAYTVYTSSN